MGKQVSLGIVVVACEYSGTQKGTLSSGVQFISHALTLLTPARLDGKSWLETFYNSKRKLCYSDGSLWAKKYGRYRLEV